MADSTENKGLSSKIWGGIGHVSRALWLYHLAVPLVVAAATFVEGVMAGFPLAILIPLTAVAAGATLYFVNQFIALFSRFREGYAYGLAYEGPYIGFNPNEENAVLQLGVNIRNVSAKPLRYVAKRFDVVVEDRTIAVPTFQSTGGIIPHATGRQYFYPPFRKAQVEEFIGKTVQGSITFEFLYGHPEAPSVRLLKMKLSISLRLDESVPSVT